MTGHRIIVVNMKKYLPIILVTFLTNLLVTFFGYLSIVAIYTLVSSNNVNELVLAYSQNLHVFGIVLILGIVGPSFIYIFCWYAMSILFSTVIIKIFQKIMFFPGKLTQMELFFINLLLFPLAAFLSCFLFLS
jgi:hypothetical protein